MLQLPPALAAPPAQKTAPGWENTMAVKDGKAAKLRLKNSPPFQAQISKLRNGSSVLAQTVRALKDVLASKLRPATPLVFKLPDPQPRKSIQIATKKVFPAGPSETQRPGSAPSYFFLLPLTAQLHLTASFCPKDSSRMPEFPSSETATIRHAQTAVPCRTEKHQPLRPKSAQCSLPEPIRQASIH